MTVIHIHSFCHNVDMVFDSLVRFIYHKDFQIVTTFLSLKLCFCEQFMNVFNNRGQVAFFVDSKEMGIYK